MFGFTKPIRAIIVGGNGGVGQEFIRQLSQDPNVESIIATYRRSVGERYSNVDWVPVDVTDEASIAGLAKVVREKEFSPNVIINCVGILHSESFGPEKTWRHLEATVMHRVFAINAFAVALLGKHLLSLIPRDERSIFASISARVGSISDNRLGGWYSYRASKTAHNMFIKTLSLEATRKHPLLTIVALHPGTVETSLSEPFTRNYDSNKLFSPTRSVDELSRVLTDLTPLDTGGFFAWDGQSIEY